MKGYSFISPSVEEETGKRKVGRMRGRIRRPIIIRRTVPVTDTALCRRRLRESVALAKIRRQIGIALWSAAAGGRLVSRHFGGAVAGGRRRRRAVSWRGGGRRRRAVAGVWVSVVAAMVAVAQALHQVVTEWTILNMWNLESNINIRGYRGPALLVSCPSLDGTWGGGGHG